jgi:hypothetical protein
MTVPLTAEDIETASQRFKKALVERALGGEFDAPPLDRRRGFRDLSRSRGVRACL